MSLMPMKQPKWVFWLRVVFMTVSFFVVLGIISYLQKGQLQENPAVQSFMNPEATGPVRSARVVVGSESPQENEAKKTDTGKSSVVEPVKPGH